MFTYNNLCLISSVFVRGGILNGKLAQTDRLAKSERLLASSNDQLLIYWSTISFPRLQTFLHQYSTFLNFHHGFIQESIG